MLTRHSLRLGRGVRGAVAPALFGRGVLSVQASPSFQYKADIFPVKFQQHRSYHASPLVRDEDWLSAKSSEEGIVKQRSGMMYKASCWHTVTLPFFKSCNVLCFL